jgi:hypothetical protein
LTAHRSSIEEASVTNPIAGTVPQSDDKRLRRKDPSGNIPVNPKGSIPL